MSDRPFLDTNVLVYAIGEDPKRTPRAEALLADGGVLSVQILNELAVVARRKLKMPWSEIVEAIAAIRLLCPEPLPLTVGTHEAALRIASEYGFNFYDALIVAAALEAECPVVYSEDLQDGQVIDKRLRVENPFAAL